MAKIGHYLRSGDWRSLVASFLYFDTGFTVWLLFGPLAPYMGPHLHLAPAALGFLVAVPVLSGALLRVPLGNLYQTLDGRTIALMGITLSALTPLYLLLAPAAPTFGVLLVLGVLLGVGGASFAVALPMAGSGYPPRMQGLVLGLAAAGNIGAVLDGVLFPPLARHYGWQAAMTAVLPLLALAAFALWVWGRDHAPKAGSIPRALMGFWGALIFLAALVMVTHKGWLGVSGHPAVLLLPVFGMAFMVALLPSAQRRVLREGDAWAFFLIYAITFGGFVGLSAYVSVLLIALYHIPKVLAGLLMAGLAFSGATVRPLGGLLADHAGGPRILLYALSGIALVDLAFALFVPAPAVGIAALFALYFCFGIGNGATFQMVPLCWPKRRGLMTGLIGAAGGIGGFYLPVVLGIVKQATASYRGGFAVFAGLAMVATVLVQVRGRSWVLPAQQVDIEAQPVPTGAAIEGD
ncbi:MFS transporter [Acidiferrobacter sp.]|jgi:NNP family nitrate/nitrite transporter-like MFS transporter|uniref:MFS transporter n=1 Tax=Acidiferrobacter sp. TaxID=1872107 RepID=UPI00261EE489|nr:MFS transporter [Acidiferrobacter sp.]